MGQTEIYQHFNREDHEFIDRCIELSERVVERYSVEVTGFLNPHQVTILRNVAASYQLQVFASSDEQKMEYAKVIVAPDYYQLDPSDFDLALLEMVCFKISSLDPFPGNGDHCSPIRCGAQVLWRYSDE